MWISSRNYTQKITDMAKMGMVMIIFFLLIWDTNLAHKYNVYAGANLNDGCEDGSSSVITLAKHWSCCVSGNSKTAGKIGSCPRANLLI